MSNERFLEPIIKILVLDRPLESTAMYFSRSVAHLYVTYLVCYISGVCQGIQAYLLSHVSRSVRPIIDAVKGQRRQLPRQRRGSAIIDMHLYLHAGQSLSLAKICRPKKRQIKKTMLTSNLSVQSCPKLRTYVRVFCVVLAYCNNARLKKKYPEKIIFQNRSMNHKHYPLLLGSGVPWKLIKPSGGIQNIIKGTMNDHMPNKGVTMLIRKKRCVATPFE